MSWRSGYLHVGKVMTMRAPLVSILMVARNTAPFIDLALRSARAQTVSDIEIIVVDDGSTDGTKEIAAAHARADGRVRLIDGPCKGLSAVRNSSLRAAQGRFAAILDSDDVLHPRHLQELIDGQAQSGAPICASNMVEFDFDGPVPKAAAFATGKTWQASRAVELEEFVRGGMIGSRNLSLGYLKPMFEMEFIRSRAIAYDERLRIGEDFDLVLRAMFAGAQYHFLPQPHVLLSKAFRFDLSPPDAERPAGIDAGHQRLHRARR